MTYLEELKKAMKLLSQKDDTIFIGQNLVYGGIAMCASFENIPLHKRIEAPVAENLQMGLSIGMALNGYVPISIYPRWNFLLLAADQVVNHLDKLSLMSDGQYRPKVIVRVAAGIKGAIDPQEQHRGDYSEAFRSMLKTCNVVNLDKPEQIVEEYLRAYERTDGISTILSEVHQF